MDLLGRLSNGRLCNIEFQTTNELRLPERVAAYYLDARMRYGEHVEQLVILAGLRGLDLEIIGEARTYMPFVIDLMENRIFRNRYERGLAEGELKEALKVLRGQLTKRFGRLPQWAQKRLTSATTQQLESWSLKLLDARRHLKMFSGNR